MNVQTIRTNCYALATRFGAAEASHKITTKANCLRDALGYSKETPAYAVHIGTYGFLCIVGKLVSMDSPLPVTGETGVQAISREHLADLVSYMYVLAEALKPEDGESEDE